MAKICKCEFCGNDVKTTGKTHFRCCNCEQEVATHLKRPNNKNKATINKKVNVHKQLEKQDLKKLEPLKNPTAINTMEETKPEEIKKEVTETDILPEKPEQPVKELDEIKGEILVCSNCDYEGLTGNEERCPKCDFEFE